MFELAVAIAYTVAGAAFLADSRTSLRFPPGASRPVDYVWGGLYVTAGPLVICGVLCRKTLTHIVGLILLTCGLLMQGLSAALLTSDPRAAIYFIYATATALRALYCILSVLGTDVHFVSRWWRAHAQR